MVRRKCPRSRFKEKIPAGNLQPHDRLFLPLGASGVFFSAGEERGLRLEMGRFPLRMLEGGVSSTVGALFLQYFFLHRVKVEWN